MTQPNFFLGEDLRIFRESLARWLAEHWSLAERRRLGVSEPGYSREAWMGLAEMGVLGAFLPERAGGAGGGGPELMVAMESFGRALFASPYLWTVALAGPLLAGAGSAGEAYLGRIAGGEAIASVAITEAQSRYDLHHVETRARRTGTGYTISGAKRAVPYGAAADILIVPARTAGDLRDRDGISLFLVPAGAGGLTRKSFATADGLRAADITLRDVEVGANTLLGSPGRGLEALQRAVDLATLAQAAEAVGAMRSLLDSTLAYARTREQFGVKLGSFQALQHRMVDMFAATEMAASHVQAALAGIRGPEDSVDPRAAVMVKLQVDQAARLVGQEAIQIHGGMGMTDDLDVGHHFKRLTMMALTFADQGKLDERYRALQTLSS
jgi:alkylation response protein AidB-like acyl-CoA dehydrogenase